MSVLTKKNYVDLGVMKSHHHRVNKSTTAAVGQTVLNCSRRLERTWSAACVRVIRADYAVSLLAEGGELLFSVSWRCSEDLRISGSPGLASISSLLQLTGEPISDERSPGFSGVACRAAVESGRFIMYSMFPRRLDTCRAKKDIRNMDGNTRGHSSLHLIKRNTKWVNLLSIKETLHKETSEVKRLQSPFPNIVILIFQTVVNLLWALFFSSCSFA